MFKPKRITPEGTVWPCYCCDGLGRIVHGEDPADRFVTTCEVCDGTGEVLEAEPPDVETA